MHEGVELPEAHAAHGESPLTIPVSVTMSILAVLVAGATLLGHRAHTEELLLQSEATDKWSYYQAKNIRFHEVQSMVDLLDSLATPNTEKVKAAREKYAKEVERYQEDKTDIGDEARTLEAQRDVLGRRADRFDGGEALFEVGLVICSMTLLTKRRFFWLAGMLVGAAAVVLAITGFLLH
jgi:Domain of unknown function (DUF4337)